MSFKTWLKIYRQNYSKRREEIDFGIDRESSDEEEERIQDDDYDYEVLEDVTVIEEEDQDHMDADIVESDSAPINGNEEKLNESDPEEFKIKLQQTLRGESYINLESCMQTPSKKHE